MRANVRIALRHRLISKRVGFPVGQKQNANWLLGRSDQLRVVPALIDALSDPDRSVRRYARDGLRFISRKFDGFGMPDDPTHAEWQQAQQQWRDWYHSVNPKHVFLAYGL